MKGKGYSLLLFFMCSFGALQAINRLFLENRYGAEIICKVKNNNKSDSTMLFTNKETPIGNGVRVLLGAVPFDSQQRSKWVTSLEIKASRYVSALSSFTPLDDYLDAIVKQLIGCCTMKMNAQICKQNICDKDAVIVIKPSYIMSEWDISWQWEAPWR